MFLSRLYEVSGGWEDNGTTYIEKFKIEVQRVTKILRTLIELQWKHSMQIFQVFETYALAFEKKKNRHNQFFWAIKNEHPKQTIFF